MSLFAFLLFLVLSSFLPCLPSEHVLSAQGCVGFSPQGWAQFFVNQSLGQAVGRLSLWLSVSGCPQQSETGI